MVEHAVDEGRVIRGVVGGLVQGPCCAWMGASGSSRTRNYRAGSGSSGTVAAFGMVPSCLPLMPTPPDRPAKSLVDGDASQADQAEQPPDPGDGQCREPPRSRLAALPSGQVPDAVLYVPAGTPTPPTPREHSWREPYRPRELRTVWHQSSTQIPESFALDRWGDFPEDEQFELADELGDAWADRGRLPPFLGLADRRPSGLAPERPRPLRP